MKEILFIIVIILFYGCRSDTIKVTGEGKKIIVDPEKCSNSIELSDLYNSKYIILESTKNSLIGKIDKIYVTKTTIYILDRDVTNSLFIFNKDGSFVKKVAKKGRGPGEYVQLDDFDIIEDKNEIHLYCGDQKRILIYNLGGKFKESIKLTDFGYVINLFPCGKYLTISTRNLRNVTFWDSNGRKLTSYVQKDNLLWKVNAPIAKLNHTCLINFPFYGDIYQVDGEQLVKRFFVDFKSKNFPIAAITDNKKLMKINSLGKYARLISFTYFNDILHFNFSYHNRIKYGVFLEKKDKTIIANQLFLNSVPSFSIKGCCTDGLILSSQASSILDFFRLNKKSDIRLPDYYNCITENSNPIIALLQLK